MIAQLKGILIKKDTVELIVDVHGVGYEVKVSKTTLEQLPEIGQQVTLLIHTHVTESSFVLYGFNHSLEKILFKKLLTVSGVGPRMAIQILSGLSSQELIRALLDENLVSLTAISGVGKKTAERLIVELKDKIISMADQLTIKKTLTPEESYKQTTYDEVLSALVNLGYNRLIAEKAMANIIIKPDSSLKEVLKSSLVVLAK